MRKLLLIALLPLAGCAMTPEQQDQFRANFMGGLAAGAALRPQPVYYPPPPMAMPTTTICRRSFNNTVVCDTQ